MFELYSPTRISLLGLPEHSETLGQSVRASERLIETVRSSRTVIDLTGADTHRFPPPDWVVGDFTEAANGAGATYTPARGDVVVREKVADSLSRFIGRGVEPETELILTPGTQAGLFLAIGSLIEAGDTVLLPDPDYLLTERICRFYGAKVERVAMSLNEDGSAQLDLDQLEALMKRGPRLFVFSNPNNPNGAVYSASTLKEIADLAQKYGVFVLADELYTRLVYDGRPSTHISTQPGMREMTLTLMGPSKTESMSGFRVGAAFGPGELIERMSDLLYVSAIRCPAYAQHVLKGWLADDHDYVAQRIVQYQELRDLAVHALRQIPGISVATPGGTSYVFPSFRDLGVSDVDFCGALKEEVGLIVNPGFQFGMASTGHLRICFAQETAVLAESIERIAELVDGRFAR